MMPSILSVPRRGFRLNPLAMLSALALAGAAPLVAGTLFFEDFETPDVSDYEQGVTPPDRWVRAAAGYGSGDHGMIDKNSGDFTAPDPNHQAYTTRYTNSGITTAAGVLGPPLALGAAYEISFDVVKDNNNAGVGYNVRLLAFNPGAARNSCQSSGVNEPAGATELAEASGNAPANGSFATVTFTYNPPAGAPVGKDLAIQVLGAGGRAIVDNIRFRTIPRATAGLNLVTTHPLDNEVKALTYEPLLAVFDKNIAAGSGNITVKNLSNPIDTVIPVSDPRVTISGTLLQIEDSSLLQWGQNYAIQIDAGAVVEASPGSESFAGIANDTTWNFSTSVGDPLLYSVSRLKQHITGVITLTAAQISEIKIDLDSVAPRFAESADTITALLDLVQTYDTSTITGRKGPLWVATGLPKRDSVINDLPWTMFNVMQNIMDRIYTEETLATHEALLNGFKFRSSSNFPGNCVLPAPNTHTATLSANYLDTFGKATIGDGNFTFARKPTGTYLSPGTVATVTVPASMVNTGYKIRVGAHSSDFKEKPDIKRLNRVSLTYEITSLQTKVANPLGGGIYIEVPWLANAGVVNVDITGAVRSPYFSGKSFHMTTAAEWEIERALPGPWADFQSDKFMMQVPKGWISAMTGAQAVQLMANWDASMDAMHDLLGYPRIRGKESLYPQVDLLLKNSVYAPGYPSVNSTYNPATNYNGYGGSHLVRGPQFAPYYEFHELGHGYFFPKFSGESESNVNLLHVAVMNRAHGKTLDEGHRTSMGGNNLYQTLDTTGMAWMCVFNFSPREVPMNSIEKQYQLKGHAKFVDIAKLYGWEKLDAFWYAMQLENVTSPSDDTLLLRLCKAVGKDIRPLFHFWGIHPKNPATLAASLAAEGILPDPAIRARLLEYKALVPANNAAFRTFALGWWGKQPSMSGAWEQREHARQWDTTPLYGPGDQQRTDATNPGEIYNENSANDIRNRIDELIDLYFAGTLGPDPLTFAIAPTAVDPTTIGMTSTTATSGNGAVEYYFENTTTETNSGWITSSTWNQTGLTAGTSYSFRVKARDVITETAFSGTFSATPATDTTPPSPAAMAFAALPEADGIASITMTATTVTDINGVEYYFENTSGSGNDSGWQDSPSYTDIGLNPGTAYSYRVMARDKSAAQNATTWSIIAAATTEVPDETPPSILSVSPADDSIDALVAGNLVVTFDEPITVNNGSITLKNLSDATQTVIDVDDASQVTVSGAVLTINPTVNFLPGKDFAIVIDTDAFQDISGNPFGGILVDTAWNFRTEVLPFVWTQTAGSAQDWITGTNWLAGTAPDPIAGDIVDFSSVNLAANTAVTQGADRSAQLWKFGDTTGAQTWTVSAGNSLILAGTTPTIQVNNATTILENVVAGSAGLVKSGGGTLDLKNSANTYTGGTTINAGVLKITGNGSLGSGGLTFNASASFNVPNGVSLNRALTLDNSAVVSFTQTNASITISGAVTGSGGLVPASAGSSTLTLSSLANSFTGPVTLASGIFPSTIVVNSFADSTTPGAGKIFLGSQTGYGAGTFRWGSGATSALDLTNRQFVLGSGAGGYFGAIENANTDSANTVTVHSDLIVGAGSGTSRQLILTGVNTGSNTFAGSIGNGTGAYEGVTVAVTKSGAGNWRIAHPDNTFTGAISVSAGTLSYASAAGTNPLTFTNTTGSATLTYIGAAPLTMSGLITASALTSGTITLNASGTTAADTIQYSNPASLTAVATSSSVRKLVLTGGNTGHNIFNGALTNNTGTTHAATLTKNGSGTWILTGANAHTGATTVSTGKLFINGDQSTASGTVSVAANATLGGTGVIGGNTTIADTGKLEFDLSAAPGSHDPLELAATRMLTFSGASTLTITSSGGATTGNYTLVTAPGGIAGNAPAALNLPANWAATVSKVGNDLVLNVTSIGVISDPYATWSGSAAFAADANNDGVANGLAWLLGAASPSANALGKLPVATQSGGDLVLNFTCLKSANRGTAALKLQYSRDLGITDAWTSHEAAVPGDEGGTVNGVVFVPGTNADPALINMQATIPALAASPGSKLFARLAAEK